MLRKKCLVRRLCVSATFVLGSSFGYCQSPSEPPSEVTSTSITLPATTALKVSDTSAIVTGHSSFEDGTAPVVGMPYSAIGTTQSATLFLDGNRIVRTEATRFFRDSQGRTRVEHMFPPTISTVGSASTIMMVTINDPVRGERYMLHPQQKSADVLPWRGASVIQPPVPTPALSARLSLPGFGFGAASSDAESKAVSLGEKTIDGIRVVGTQLEHTVQVNAIGNQKPIVITVEQWFSPELGVVILATHRSTIGSETTYQMEQIVRAEPDGALFGVPPDYTRREANVMPAQSTAVLSSSGCVEATKKP
jgi:hypothetical protein